MNEYTPELFELIDDDGNKRNFELIDYAELDGECYYAMIPEYDVDDIMNADLDIVLLKSAEEDGEEFLVTIEDNLEYVKVSEYFIQRMKEATGYDE
ncbi:MAG: DUF1292 domain-containing protein [Ruminococcus sp.]|nr:DUF1292 domain-containing protein [Ruminococcus sp.]